MNADITIADLAKLRTIIEVACTRGAFRADEMRSVGETYDRLVLFLDGIVKDAENQHNQESTPEPKESNDD